MRTSWNGLDLDELEAVAKRGAALVHVVEREDCAREFMADVIAAGEVRLAAISPEKRRRYLRTYARRFALNYERSRRRREAHTVPLDDCAAQRMTSERLPEAELIRAEFWNEVRAALEALTPLQRTLIVRVLVDGDAVGVVAIELGMRPSAVHKRIGLARSRLRQRLEQHGMDATSAYGYLSAVLHGLAAGEDAG